MPRVAWEVVRGRLARDWKPGEHCLVVGKTGSGKSHLLAELAEIRRWVVVIATKTSDPLLTELERDGYRRIRSKSRRPGEKSVQRISFESLQSSVRVRRCALARPTSFVNAVFGSRPSAWPFCERSRLTPT